MSGMDIFNIIAGISSIVGFFVSLFIANKLININKSFNIGSDVSETTNKLKGVTINGAYSGRDTNK